MVHEDHWSSCIAVNTFVKKSLHFILYERGRNKFNSIDTITFIRIMPLKASLVNIFLSYVVDSREFKCFPDNHICRHKEGSEVYTQKKFE